MEGRFLAAHPQGLGVDADERTAVHGLAALTPHRWHADAAELRAALGGAASIHGIAGPASAGGAARGKEESVAD